MFFVLVRFFLLIYSYLRLSMQGKKDYQEKFLIRFQLSDHLTPGILLVIS
jgi:hypothetical protein